MVNKRLFIAIDLSPQVTEQLAAIQKKFNNQKYIEIRPIKSDQLHLTLAFLGDVEQAKIADIAQILRSIQIEAFQACLDAIGYFPASDYLRIIWVSLKAEQLKILAHEIAEKLRQFVTLENREFASHITIARVKKVHDRHAAIDFINTIKVSGTCFLVNEFVLRESILSNEGPTYIDVERYSLLSS